MPGGFPWTKEKKEEVLRMKNHPDKNHFQKEWRLGMDDRGLGRMDYAIMTSSHVLATKLDKEVAEHIIKLHNNHLKRRKNKRA